MQDFNQNRKGRNLRKYCNDEGIDYKWLSEYKRTYGVTKTVTVPQPAASDYGFTALDIIEERLSPEQQHPSKNTGWTVKQIIICSPEGEELELRSDNLLVVSKLLSKNTTLHPTTRPSYSTTRSMTQ